MEAAILKTVNTEAWLLQFGICVTCHEELLAEPDPTIVAVVGAKMLRRMLKSNKTMFDGSVLWKKKG